MTKNPYKKSWQNEMETAKAIGWDEGYEAGLSDGLNPEEKPVPFDPNLLAFYKKKGYNLRPDTL